MDVVKLYQTEKKYRNQNWGMKKILQPEMKNVCPLPSRPFGTLLSTLYGEPK